MHERNEGHPSVPAHIHSCEQPYKNIKEPVLHISKKLSIDIPILFLRVPSLHALAFAQKTFSVTCSFCILTTWVVWCRQQIWWAGTATLSASVLKTVAKALDIINTGPRDTKSQRSGTQKLEIQRLEFWWLCCIQLLWPKFKYNILRLNLMSWQALHGSLGPRFLNPQFSGHWAPSPRFNIYTVGMVLIART